MVGRDLLVCDLDGTLLDGSLTLDGSLVDAFHAARDRGLLISLATGRMPPGAEPYREELGLTEPSIYYNGALVRDPGTGADLLALTLPRGCLGETYAIFAHAPVHPLFYRDDRLHCLDRTLPIRGYAAEQGLPLEVIEAPEEFLALGAFVKTLFIGHPAVLPTLRAELEPVVSGRARLVMTRKDYLEIIPAAASKGAAVRWLAARLDVPLERVVAVGDQENDLEMVEAAGVGVAMPQSPPRLREVADRIAPEPGRGGLLAVLRDVLSGYFG